MRISARRPMIGGNPWCTQQAHRECLYQEVAKLESIIRQRSGPHGFPMIEAANGRAHPARHHPARAYRQNGIAWR